VYQNIENLQEKVEEQISRRHIFPIERRTLRGIRKDNENHLFVGSEVFQR